MPCATPLARPGDRGKTPPSCAAGHWCAREGASPRRKARSARRNPADPLQPCARAFCVLCSVTGGAAYPARVTARVRRLCAPTRPRLSRRLEQPLLTTPPSFLCFLRASHGTSSAGRPRCRPVVVHHSRRSSRTRALNVPASRADGQSCWHCEKRRLGHSRWIWAPLAWRVVGSSGWA